MKKATGLTSILFLILAITVLVSLSAGMYLRHLNSAFMQKGCSDMLAVTQTIAKRFDYSIGTEIAVLASVCESLTLEDVLRFGDNQKLTRHLASQQQRNDFEITGFQFPNGQAHLSNGSAVKNFLTEKEAAQTYEKGWYVSEPQGASEANAQIITAIPVYQNNVKAGILFAGKLSVFFKQAARSELLLGYTPWFIINPAGKIILKNSNATYDKITNKLLNQIDNGKPFFKTAAEKGSGTSVHSYLPGEEYLISYFPLEYNGWQLLTVYPMERLPNQPEKHVVRVWIIFTSIIIILIMMVFVIRYIARQHSLKLYNIGFIDPLTNLPNFNNFSLNSPDAIAKFKKGGVPFAVVAINILRFKAINNIYGLERGEEILKCIAADINKELAQGELMCRLFADRFFMLLACPDKGQFTERITNLLKKISRFNINEYAGFDITVNAGAYLAGGGEPFQIMIDRANIALNSIHYNADKNFYFYNDNDRKRLEAVAKIESRMNTALAEKQFKLYIQPKYGFQTRRIESAEALVRWQDGTTLIQPADFIPVFEQNGFILKVDMFILEETVKLLAKRKRSGKNVVPIGVNFSRLHLETPHFIDDVIKIVDRHKVAHNLIEIEITESVAFNEKETMRSVVNTLHANGFSVAMDDFGSGYSSLNILKDLYFDCIKLDKEFLTSAASDERMRQIISSTVAMIKKLGSIIVTEGIETAEQVEFLRSIGCDLAQGYIFSRPLPAAEFEKLLDEDFLKHKDNF